MAIDVINDLQTLRADAVRIFRAALRRVDPREAVKYFIRVTGDALICGGEGFRGVRLDLAAFDHIYVVGGGKATAPMAAAVEDLLGDRITAGIISVKYGFTESLGRTEISEAGHPLPDQKGVEGTRKILEVLAKAGERDLILSLISGGGSALLPHPAGDISLEEKQAVTLTLLECGADIHEINTIRKHISATKGGQMARAAHPATVVNLMLSDVVGDDMDVIASGPFVPDSSTFEEALKIIEKYGLEDIPPSVREHLIQGAKKRIPETPKEGDPVFERVHNYVIGSNILALEAAAEEAGERGYRSLILSSMVEGETREAAKIHVAVAREILKTGRPLPVPACIISGGETTVRVRGKGLGGRNQEFCLAAALELQKLPPRVVVLSGGTDGNDGPTDAAGAIVDPLTVKRGIEAGIGAAHYLDYNDSYHYFQKTGELLVTGPTNTNVMDVRILLVK